MEQTRLFRLAVESGSLHFNHIPGSGWALRVGVRRGDEDWRDVEYQVYSHLGTQELLDVIYAHLDASL